MESSLRLNSKNQGRFPASDTVVASYTLVVLASALDFFISLTGRNEGDFALGGAGGTLLVLALLVSDRAIREETKKTLILFGALALVYLVGILREPDVKGLKHFSQIVFLLGVFLFFANVKLSRSVGIGINLVSWIALGVMLTFAASIADQIATFDFGRKNVLGGIIYYLLMIVAISTLSDTIRWFTFPVTLIIGFFLNQRMLLALALNLVIAYSGLSIFRTRRRSYVVFLVLLIAVTTFVITYTMPDRPVFYEWINQLLIDTTQRSLYSGRQELWPLILVKISESPLIGHGSGATPQNLLNVELSSHNLYLQVLLQVGVLGLGVLIVLLLSIWDNMARALNIPRVRFAAAAFLSIILHQMSEVSLIQNQFAMGILQWTLIGLATSQVYTSSSRYHLTY